MRSARLIEGDNKIYEHGADSGFKNRFHFCPIAAATSLGGDWTLNIYGITVGSHADPDFLPPAYSAWREVMRRWHGMATATEHLPQGRPPPR
jgi:hypothetical protein